MPVPASWRGMKRESNLILYGALLANFVSIVLLVVETTSHQRR